MNTEEDVLDVEVVADTPRKPRGPGFRALTPEQRRAAGSKGGKKAQAGGRAHRFTSESAAAASAIATASGNKRRFTPEEAREVGRKGGLANQAKRRAERAGGAS